MTGAVELRHLIAGEWQRGGGSVLSSVNPARPDVVVAEGVSATAADLDDAVAAARAARDAWAHTPIHERGAVLIAAAAVIDRNAEDWGLELAIEEGKTKAEGIGEVRRAAQILRYYGNEGDRSAGEIFASPRAGEQILVTRKPIGVVAVITPFNFPIAIPAWKIAPALVYGNTVVWKPASTVPLLAIRLADALTDRGPAGGCAQPDHRGCRDRRRPGQPRRHRRHHLHRVHRGGTADRRRGGGARCAGTSRDGRQERRRGPRRRRLRPGARAGDAGCVPVHRPEVHRHFTFDRDRQDRRSLSGGPGGAGRRAGRG